jgi:hypothetical protein
MSASAARADEFRAFWVDAWHSGFKSSSQTTALVNYLKLCNTNAIIAQMEKKGDAYFSSTYFPWASDAGPGYDCLADLVTKAHAQNMEVHAWVCVYRIWTTENTPPAGHVKTLHPEWLSETSGGVDHVSSGDNAEWYIDPGVPEVEDWLVDAYVDMINNYDLDGLTFDRIRYPGTDWGYNPTAVARFNEEFGRTGNPSSGDPDWTSWRQAQINAFVKKCYLNVIDAESDFKVGAAVWHTSSIGARDYLQDWDAWTLGHYIDYVAPMNYTTSNSTWRSRNEANLADANGRHVYALTDACSNTDANVNYQLIDARNTGLHGLSVYSYYCDGGTLQPIITDPGTGCFPSPIPPPTPMPWQSTMACLKGTVTRSGSPVYKVTVTINGTGLSTTTDGTGFFGIVDVPPGTYTVTASKCGHIDSTATGVSIVAGNATTQDFSLAADGVAPVITNVQATDIQATNAVISWTTDEVASSQVEYGTTATYGSITPENTLKVTSHSMLLTGLTSNILYHYRVISKDCAGTTGQSGDNTFTTIGYDTPAPIILDNDAPSGVTFSGSWITASSATEKYGADYRYCSGYTQPKTCEWRPTVISAANYNVYGWWADGANRTTHAPYTVYWNGGSQALSINQQDPNSGGKWQRLVANKPYAVGTGGYVKLTNIGVESTLNVHADAVMLFPDAEPPSVPSGLTATAASTSQINLSWTASTDNSPDAAYGLNAIRYKVYRNSVEIADTNLTTAQSTGLSTSTSYSYTVSAYDAAGNSSAQCGAAARYTLPAAPSGGSVTCDKSTGTWYTSTSFVFTSTEAFGAGTRQYYRAAWDTSPTHTWTGGEAQWNSGTYEATCEDSGQYYMHVQSCNGDGVANGTLDLGPYNYDITAPQMDSLDDDGAYTDAAGQLHATWAGSDPEAPIAEYQYAVGTAPDDLGTVVPWTTVSTDTEVTTTGLTLTEGTAYYFGVKARNEVDLWSSVRVSDGITAADVVATVSEAKDRPDVKAVMMSGKVVSANFGTFFYVCDYNASDPDDPNNRTPGIRVNATSPPEGYKGDVGGIIQTINGERVLTSPEVENFVVGGGTVPAQSMLNRDMGGAGLNSYTPGVTGGVGTNNIGALVTITGRVTHAESGFCYVDDGCNLLDGSGFTGVKVDTSTLVTNIPSENQYVVITGISATEQAGSDIRRLLRPRGDGDVVIYP